MKHFNLLKTTLLLCALIVGSLSSWAEKITNYSNIVSGAKYYIGATSGGNDYYLSVDGSTTSESIAGTAVSDKENATVFVFSGSGTSWSIQFDGTSNYLSLASSKANGKVKVVSAASTFTTSNQSGKIRLTIGDYSVQKNNSGTQFGSYANTQTDIWLEEAAAASPLTSITLSGTYLTSFNEGDTFNHDGMVVTATYENESSKDVSNKATFSGYNMNSIGNQEVTVSYTEGDITKTAKYNITVNELPKYTVTFSDGGSVTQASYGAKVTLPTRSAISSFSFAGWSEANVPDETTTAPTIIPSGDYTPAADITLYPVYSKTEGASGIQNKTASVSISDYASANKWNNGTAYQPLVMDENVSIGGTVSGNNFKYYSSDFSWRFYTGGSFTITASNGTLTSVKLTYSGTLKYNDNSITSGFAFDVAGSTALLSCTANSKITAITVNYTIGNQGTTYYWSAPVAATVERPEITLDANPFTFSTTATITCATDGVAIKYSYDGENWSDYTSPLTITETKTIYAKAVLNSDESQVASVTATKNLVEPTVTIDATGITNTNLFAGTDAGSLSASVTYNDAAVEGAVVTWSGSDDEVAIINSTTGAVTLAGAGSVTFTATYAGNSDYSGKTATYEMTVVNDNPNAPGKQSNPYTVAQARAAIDAGEGVAGVYATGIVSEIVTAYNSQYGNISYNISVDGKTTSDQLQSYRGKSYNGDNFTSADDIQIGDVVVIYGNLKKHNSTYEFDQNNQLVSRVTKTAPTFALDVKEKTLDAYTHETVDVTLTTNTDGEVTCESSNTDVATVTLKSAGVYTITAQSEGSATITIKSATSATYKPASATVAITVEDGRTDAGISFAETGIEKTWGEIFIGQALTNTNSVEVTYSSTDESVAIVSSTGVVTVLKAGTTTIKATFAGNATYKASVASYDLTINKAEAGLSFDETEFEVDLNDDSFVAPTLNNPNSLTVTYDSNNDELALVDNTGELLLVTSAEGTVKITASFAGNDNYKSGSASYTITVTDPNKKGTKKNPYTVAEVKNGTATGSGIYVVGYIVGNYNATSPVNPATGDTNLALADNADETAGSNTIPVELQDKGSLREDWGPKSNNLIGYKVLIKGNKDTYFSTNGIKKVTEISAVSVPVSITAAGFATYAGDFGLDFSGLDVKVYKARVNGTTITFDKVTEVPAGEGVLLQGEGTFEVPVKSVDAWAADDNAFVRGTGAAVATGDGPYNYILNKVNSVVGFYKANGQTVAKNRAYLQSTTAAARISLNFDEETTGISEVVKSDVNNKVFDLQGRHIAQPTKGLYIMNGRKVLVK